MTIDAPQSLNQISREHSRSQAETVTAVERLVYAYYDGVYRLALSILNDEDEAHDAAQETFVAAAAAFDDFRGEAQVKTWLFAIAINECRGSLRRRQRRERLQRAVRKVQVTFTNQPPSPEEEAVHSEEKERLRQAVETLHERHQLPILLRYVHNLTAVEIAEVLDISEGTVYSRLHYARQQLQRLLKA